MSNPKSETVKVQKTSRLNQRKLNRVARRYNITPICVREIQLGFVQELPLEAAELLKADGYVTFVTTEPRPYQEQVDSLQTIAGEKEPTVEIDDSERVTLEDGQRATLEDEIDDVVDPAQDEEEQV